jgi:hypothetical protein
MKDGVVVIVFNKEAIENLAEDIKEKNACAESSRMVG